MENPQIIGIILIDEPVGVYYGGTIAAPVMSEIYDMVLPYLFRRTERSKRKRTKKCPEILYTAEVRYYN